MSRDMDERIKQKNIPPALYHIEQEGLKLHLSKLISEQKIEGTRGILEP